MKLYLPFYSQPERAVTHHRSVHSFLCRWTESHVDSVDGQIVDMKYRGLSFNYYDVGVDMKIDMGLEVFVSAVYQIE